jgi:transketolase N-terminal domain/subunit
VPRLTLIPPREFERIAAAGLDGDERLELLADMCRLNALVAVKRAGSGHLGSTFSSLDLVAHLLWEDLNVAEVGFESPDRDVFFSSKGHDVPGLYAALNALGVIPTERLLRLRRLGGLDGHPDVGVPGIEANSGSLGMGISKARGIAWAKRHLGRGGRVVVMTGDGELQEGQNWEALQAAAHQRVGRLLVVVDRNELQSDRSTEEILALESLEAKLRAFGCRVVTCDGHDHTALRHAFAKLEEHGEGTPGVLVARTIKGKGVSFMEHPHALAEGGGTYRWHAGAPADDDFEAAAGELESRLRERIDGLGLAPLALEPAAVLRVRRGLLLRRLQTEILSQSCLQAIWRQRHPAFPSRQSESRDSSLSSTRSLLQKPRPSRPQSIRPSPHLSAGLRRSGVHYNRRRGHSQAPRQGGSLLACHPPYTSSNLIRRVSGSHSVRLMPAPPARPHEPDRSCGTTPDSLFAPYSNVHPR